MKKLTTLLFLLVWVHSSYGQTNEQEGQIRGVDRDSTIRTFTFKESEDSVIRTDFKDALTLYYRFDKAEVDSMYLSNAEVLEYIDSQLSDSLRMAYLDSLTLKAISSPEGPLKYNENLSRRRVESFRDYLVGRYPYSASKIVTDYLGEDWSGLRRMVEQSTIIPNKDEVLSIIDSDVELDAKEYRIKRIDGGRSWSYIVRNILPYLRYGATAMFHYNLQTIEKVESVQEAVIEPTPAPEPEIEKVPISVQMVSEDLYERKPLFAFKTNLLYDLATVLNIAVEVPIGNRVSLAGEWTFPWWVFDDGTPSSLRHRLQLLYGNIEARMWFGNRDNREVMTGWFAGVYGGSGKYDFEYNKDGVQGEFYSAGVSVGYAHSINKKNTLRMEYSVSGGYIQSNYRDYNSIYADTFDDKWHPIRKSTGKFSAFAPTAVKVSLVWMLYYNKGTSNNSL